MRCTQIRPVLMTSRVQSRLIDLRAVHVSMNTAAQHRFSQGLHVASCMCAKVLKANTKKILAVYTSISTPIQASFQSMQCVCALACLQSWRCYTLRLLCFGRTAAAISLLAITLAESRLLRLLLFLAAFASAAWSLMKASFICSLLDNSGASRSICMAQLNVQQVISYKPCPGLQVLHQQKANMHCPCTMCRVINKQLQLTGFVLVDSGGFVWHA